MSVRNMWVIYYHTWVIIDNYSVIITHIFGILILVLTNYWQFWTRVAENGTRVNWTNWIWNASQVNRLNMERESIKLVEDGARVGLYLKLRENFRIVISIFLANVRYFQTSKVSNRFLNHSCLSKVRYFKNVEKCLSLQTFIESTKEFKSSTKQLEFGRTQK